MKQMAVRQMSCHLGHVNPWRVAHGLLMRSAGQRGWNGQPAGSPAGSAARREGRFGAADGRGRGSGPREQCLRVGMRGVRTDGSAGELHDPPEIHDRDAVGDMADNAQVVGDEQHRQASCSCRSSSRLRICACTETSSAETSSSASRQLGLDRQRARDGDPLALPAGELVRIARRRVGRQPHQVQSSAIGRPPLRRHRCGPAAPRRACRHRHARIERAVRILEDHLHAAIERRSASQRNARTSDPRSRSALRRPPAAAPDNAPGWISRSRIRQRSPASRRADRKRHAIQRPTAGVDRASASPKNRREREAADEVVHRERPARAHAATRSATQAALAPAPPCPTAAAPGRQAAIASRSAVRRRKPGASSGGRCTVIEGSGARMAALRQGPQQTPRVGMRGARKRRGPGRSRRSGRHTSRPPGRRSPRRRPGRG